MEIQIGVVINHTQSDAATEWEKKMKLFGNPNTCGNFIGNTIFNLRARHPLFAPFIGPNKPGCSEKEAGSFRAFQIITFFINIGIGLMIFSSLGAIELYKALDCGCGCEPFEWPPTQADILADERYSEAYWPVGTKMCYPIKGDAFDASGEGTQNGKLGPMFQKPVPYQYCNEADCSWKRKDELYTWSVNVDVINGVIFGASDHHCKDDQCYYVKQEVYDKHLCRPRLVQSHSEWWTTLIVSELIQTAVSMLLLFLYKTKPEERGAGLFIGCSGCMCCCGCIGPFCFILIIAALFSSIFGNYLFFPYFISKGVVWAIDLVLVPVISIPTYIVHKREFKAKFPECKSVDDVRRKGVQPTDAGVMVSSCSPMGLLAGLAACFMFIYDVLTKLI